MTNQPEGNRMGRHPALTVLMILSGIILLLPGVCAVFFIAMADGSWTGDSAIVLLWIVCLLIAFGGAMLIWRALRRPRP